MLPSRKVPRFLVSAGLIALPMASRTRLLITAAVLCHLLLAPRLVTSQLHPTSSEHQNLPEAPHESSQPVTIQALQQEKDGPVYKLRGNVKIDYETCTFSADEVRYNCDSGDAMELSTPLRTASMPNAALPSQTAAVQMGCPH